MRLVLVCVGVALVSACIFGLAALATDQKARADKAEAQIISLKDARTAAVRRHKETHQRIRVSKRTITYPDGDSVDIVCVTEGSREGVDGERIPLPIDSGVPEVGDVYYQTCRGLSPEKGGPVG